MKLEFNYSCHVGSDNVDQWGLGGREAVRACDWCFDLAPGLLGCIESAQGEDQCFWSGHHWCEWRWTSNSLRLAIKSDPHNVTYHYCCLVKHPKNIPLPLIICLSDFQPAGLDAHNCIVEQRHSFTHVFMQFPIELCNSFNDNKVSACFHADTGFLPVSEIPKLA